MGQLDGIERAADEVIEELRIANLALDEMERLRKEEEDSYRAALQTAAKTSARLVIERNAYKADKYKWQREASHLREKLANMESERDVLSGLWRNHLDESPREDDNDWEREARQILCTDEDVEQRIQAEGYTE